MGLKSQGEYGAKKVFLDKFAASIRTFSTLDLAREGIGANRDDTIVVCDGNVLMMTAPTTVDTLAKYVQFFVSQIQSAINAGKHCVVVFDEPENITRAKREEQNARDARRTVRTPICSVDLVVCPTTDDYGRAELEDPGLNVRLLMDHRAARSRFFDTVCHDVLVHFCENMPSMEGWSLTFDGIDGRACDRPKGDPRKPGIMSSHEIWTDILDRENAVGEGDLKLPDVCHRVAQWRRKHAHLPNDQKPDCCSITLHMLWTIDTDSFVIELIQQSIREEAAIRNGDEDSMETTLLCIREPARKRKGDTEITNAHFVCADVESFYSLVVAYLFGKEAEPSNDQKKAAIALFAVSIALCGCDFVEVAGLRADLIMPAVRDVVRRHPIELNTMLAVFSGDAGRTLNARNAVSRVIEGYITSMHDDSSSYAKKRVEKASKMNDLQLLRAAWLASYWAGNEFKDTHSWGFSSSQVD